MFGAKLSWCQIVRCQIVLVPNCPGAKLSTFIILVPNCPLLLSWCQIVPFIILVPNCSVPNCPTIPPTPHPLNGKPFCQKMLNGKAANSIREKLHPKGLKMVFLYLIRLEIDQRGHIMDQKGLNMYEKVRNRVFGPKIPAF